VATSFPRTTRPPHESESVVSSLTEFVCAAGLDDNILPVYRDDNDRGQDLVSVAEINRRGTISLKKGDDSVESADHDQTPPVLDNTDASREPYESGCGGFLDCGGSRSNNVYTVASSYSAIDTATEEEHVTSKTGGFPTFTMAPASKLYVDDMSASSNETDNDRSTSTSASQFIRDLVWLENKIAMENTTKNNVVLDELEKRLSVTSTKVRSTNAKESEE
jgi:hypothetical protein